ncbi:MAG: chloride channel protein, partial [Beijerinckiaceae bacterium]|nr:chloride channel protein [Beijerinckiaceae bacterium]
GHERQPGALEPAAGGLLLGGATRLLPRLRRRRPVDPIEANALHGGRMSVTDSIAIGVQTLVSNGFGASVGLEAGYTQLGSGFASWLGRLFHLRRADMRMIVGGGAGAAIGAAFGAPLTGAFYAFELIIGTYTPFSLAPVVAASISGVLVARAIGISGDFIGHVPSTFNSSFAGIIGLTALSLACAALGIAVMRGVTLVEDLFKRSRLPTAFQPAAGGLALGLMALVTPHVLASGHGALAALLRDTPPAAWLLALTLGLKALGSAVSIGSGFRGGLFFASLYLGGLLGKLFFAVAIFFAPTLPLDSATCAIVAMAGLSVTIVGGPLTMSFLALETTGDFPLSILILAATTLVSVIVRRTFGYSFATWRLHLRGESIRSAQDVGWIRSLTVERLMRHDIETAFADASICSFLENNPLGSGHWVVATDPFDRYAGMVALSEAHGLQPDSERCKEPLSTLVHWPETVLTPNMNIREAAQLFEKTESEALAVVASNTDRRVIGLLTEKHLLRRYTEELDRVRKDLSGETWLAER